MVSGFSFAKPIALTCSCYLVTLITNSTSDPARCSCVCIQSRQHAEGLGEEVWRRTDAGRRRHEPTNAGLQELDWGGRKQCVALCTTITYFTPFSTMSETETDISHSACSWKSYRPYSWLHQRKRALCQDRRGFQHFSFRGKPEFNRNEQNMRQNGIIHNGPKPIQAC